MFSLIFVALLQHGGCSLTKETFTGSRVVFQVQMTAQDGTLRTRSAIPPSNTPRKNQILEACFPLFRSLEESGNLEETLEVSRSGEAVSLDELRVFQRKMEGKAKELRQVIRSNERKLNDLQKEKENALTVSRSSSSVTSGILSGLKVGGIIQSTSSIPIDRIRDSYDKKIKTVNIELEEDREELSQLESLIGR